MKASQLSKALPLASADLSEFVAQLTPGLKRADLSELENHETSTNPCG